MCMVSVFFPEALSHCCSSFLQSIYLSRPYTTPTQPKTPRDLAIALLILEGDKYTHILPADYISYFQQQPGEDSVTGVLEANLAITVWVQRTILRCDKLKDRRGLLEFFVSAVKVTGHVDAVHVIWTDCYIHRNLVKCGILPPRQQL